MQKETRAKIVSTLFRDMPQSNAGQVKFYIISFYKISIFTCTHLRTASAGEVVYLAFFCMAPSPQSILIHSLKKSNQSGTIAIYKSRMNNRLFREIFNQIDNPEVIV